MGADSTVCRTVQNRIIEIDFCHTAINGIAFADIGIAKRNISQPAIPKIDISDSCTAKRAVLDITAMKIAAI